MAINKNHEFEELDGIKCAIVEKNVSPARAHFLKDLLVLNGYTVVLMPTPPPKPAAAPKPAAPVAEGETPAPAPPPTPAPKAPETFTVGVTDVMFNVTNAIFGRLLKTNNGHIVTQAYWNQQEMVSHDEEPYYIHTRLVK